MNEELRLAREALRTRFGENMQALRKELEFSQEDLGYRSGLHRTEIGQLERGNRLARLDTIIKLKAALEVTPDQLLAGMDYKPGRVELGIFTVSPFADPDASGEGVQ